MSTALMCLLATLSAPLANDSSDIDDAEETEETEETEESWDVNASHGPDHTARIDTREGTWMSVNVHGGTVIFDLLGDIW
jgi:hypothetical protein